MIYSCEHNIQDDITTTILISEEELDKWPGIRTRMLGHLYQVIKLGHYTVAYFLFTEATSEKDAEEKLQALIKEKT